MRPKFDKDGIVLYQGDCLEVMSELAPSSVDTIITDPPYGLEFMGQSWDRLDWQVSTGFGKPGIGYRNIKWPRFSPNSPFGTANPTCGSCGGRLRGKKKCRCETPRWKPLRQKNGKTRAVQSLPDVHRAIQEWHRRWAGEALRVAKPGAFLLAFGGTRTFHRLASALEEAGWLIRDCIMWLYGSGFPKSWDISKAIDKAAGAQRRTVGVSSGPNHSHYSGKRYTQHRKTRFGVVQDQPNLTAPNTPAAKSWHGWGTTLKPGWEPIIVAMKPLDGTFADNALKHGVAGLAIEKARIGLDDDDRLLQGGSYSGNRSGSTQASAFNPGNGKIEYHAPPGRWPANLALTHHPECDVLGTRQIKSNGHFPARRGAGGIGTSGHKGQTNLEEKHSSGEIAERWRCHPDCPIATLDEQSGERRAGGSHSGREPSQRFVNCYGEMGRREWPSHNDIGGASRFFYCAKASRSERNEGLNCMPKKMLRWSSGPKSPGTFQSEGTDKYAHNHHPTVKPLKLMEYLCRLTATPTGGIILDPFAGSGSTLIAAANVGRKCIGIECDRDYVRIAQARLRAHSTKKLKGGLGKAT